MALSTATSLPAYNPSPNPDPKQVLQAIMHVHSKVIRIGVQALITLTLTLSLTPTLPLVAEVCDT